MKGTVLAAAVKFRIKPPLPMVTLLLPSVPVREAELCCTA